MLVLKRSMRGEGWRDLLLTGSTGLSRNLPMPLSAARELRSLLITDREGGYVRDRGYGLQGLGGRQKPIWLLAVFPDLYGRKVFP